MKGPSFLYLLLLLAVGMIVSCDEDEKVYDWPVDVSNNINKNNAFGNPYLARLEFPKVKGGKNLVITHSTNDAYGVNYSLEWDCVKKSQRWSCYQMYASNTGGNAGRYDTQTLGYPNDPEIGAKYRFDYDPYWGSGYDHGHICPSADRQYSKEANAQTFYISNMQPQRNAFNAGLWAVMEQQVRNWNRSNFRDTLFVCKGGTIDTVGVADPVIKTLGNGLIVPKYFFMAVLCKKANEYKAMAFWVQHFDTDHKNDNLGDYIINVRELERKTGIDFFCNLPDDIEERVETLDASTVKMLWGLR